MLDLLLAAVILLQPAETPVDSNVFAAAPQLQAVALAWEILDERELRYVLTNSNELQSDVSLLRRRQVDLAGAPLAADVGRFPRRQYVNDLLAFNRECRRDLEFRQLSMPARWWELTGALHETDHLYQVWDTVRDAGCEYYYVTVRRTALKRLRELIGQEAYYAGRLPPYVPVWRFQWAD